MACAKPLQTDALDMTDPAVLLPVMEAYCANKDMGYDMGRFAMREYEDDDGTLQIAQPTHFAAVGYHAKKEWFKEGDNTMECLAQVLCDALEAEKGDQHD